MGTWDYSGLDCRVATFRRHRIAVGRVLQRGKVLSVGLE